MLERPEIPIESEDLLRRSAFWAQFTAAIGTIILVFGLVRSLRTFSNLGSLGLEDNLGAFLWLGVLLVGLLPCFYLFKYASTIAASFKTYDEAIMNQSFEYLYNAIRYLGILVIVALLYYIADFVII